MSTTELREVLQQYINTADERILRIFQEIMQVEQQGTKAVIPESYYELLEEELDNTPSYSWEEVKKEMTERFAQ